MIDLMIKLSSALSRKSFLTICKSFVKPNLNYNNIRQITKSIFQKEDWNGPIQCSHHNSNKTKTLSVKTKSLKHVFFHTTLVNGGKTRIEIRNIDSINLF